MLIERDTTVVQLGGRMHYAVPKILERAGRLNSLMTDLVANAGALGLVSKLPFLSPSIRNVIKSRDPSPVPKSRIIVNELLGLRYRSLLRAARTEEERLEAFILASRTMGSFAANKMPSGTKVIYTFNGASAHLYRQLKPKGLVKILEQTIAPKEVEIELLRSAVSTFARSRNETGRISNSFLKEYISLEREEWRASDGIVCGSQFVMDALMSCGVESSKIRVIPYGINGLNYSAPPRTIGRLPRILFVGSVGMRKGAMLLIAAMRQLGDKAECHIIGPIDEETRSLTMNAPTNVIFRGALPHALVQTEYAAADIFCLPSYCEGSATAIYEALAAGLPVVTTPNSGSIVENGVSGFLTTAGDVSALCTSLENLVSDSNLRLRFGLAAQHRSQFGSIEAYAGRFADYMNEMRAPSSV